MAQFTIPMQVVGEDYKGGYEDSSRQLLSLIERIEKLEKDREEDKNKIKQLEKDREEDKNKVKQLEKDREEDRVNIKKLKEKMIAEEAKQSAFGGAIVGMLGGGAAGALVMTGAIEVACIGPATGPLGVAAGVVGGAVVVGSAGGGIGYGAGCLKGKFCR